jgi:hypothetical protein
MSIVCTSIILLTWFHLSQGEETKGMAMVFELVSHLREALVTVIQKREAKEKEIEQERERQLLEVGPLLRSYTYLLITRAFLGGGCSDQRHRSHCRILQGLVGQISCIQDAVHACIWLSGKPSSWRK